MRANPRRARRSSTEVRAAGGRAPRPHGGGGIAPSRGSKRGVTRTSTTTSHRSGTTEKLSPPEATSRSPSEAVGTRDPRGPPQLREGAHRARSPGCAARATAFERVKRREPVGAISPATWMTARTTPRLPTTISSLPGYPIRTPAVLSRRPASAMYRADAGETSGVLVGIEDRDNGPAARRIGDGVGERVREDRHAGFAVAGPTTVEPPVLDLGADRIGRPALRVPEGRAVSIVASRRYAVRFRSLPLTGESDGPRRRSPRCAPCGRRPIEASSPERRRAGRRDRCRHGSGCGRAPGSLDDRSGTCRRRALRRWSCRTRYGPGTDRIADRRVRIALPVGRLGDPGRGPPGCGWTGRSPGNSSAR